MFTTLNRVVHQTARKRLLATLCYALLDPAGASWSTPAPAICSPTA